MDKFEVKLTHPGNPVVFKGEFKYHLHRYSRNHAIFRCRVARCKASLSLNNDLNEIKTAWEEHDHDLNKKNDCDTSGLIHDLSVKRSEESLLKLLESPQTGFYFIFI